tara:strand:- start:3104 stop:3964 length:861 start_codon:yes stop_codon:yes gene_type:complete
MAIQNNIKYLAGFNVKPAAISHTGIVTFTDGTSNIPPNQKQCEAYGYTYDTATGTCKVFQHSQQLNSAFTNEGNLIKGQGNSVIGGTRNSCLLGVNNKINGLSQNNMLVGNQNEITSGISNTFVYGTLADSVANNSIVLGGNNFADTLGERQNTTIIYGGQSTSDLSFNLYMNNTVDSFFQPTENSVFYFQSEILAVRVGGANLGGAVGDFKSWVERGVVKNAAGSLSISRSQTAIVDSGTTSGWSAENTVSSTNFRLLVTGARQMTLEWIATIRITEIRTSVTLT